jgi:hypothetical protein
LAKAINQNEHIAAGQSKPSAAFAMQREARCFRPKKAAMKNGGGLQ